MVRSCELAALIPGPCNGDSWAIERSRCRGIEVVAGVAVPAASSTVAGALGMDRPVHSDER
jgi:hypothetical protein